MALFSILALCDQVTSRSWLSWCMIPTTTRWRPSPAGSSAHPDAGRDRRRENQAGLHTCAHRSVFIRSVQIRDFGAPNYTFRIIERDVWK